jgi:hypothetical protein
MQISSKRLEDGYFRQKEILLYSFIINYAMITAWFLMFYLA